MVKSTNTNGEYGEYVQMEDLLWSGSSHEKLFRFVNRLQQRRLQAADVLSCPF